MPANIEIKARANDIARLKEVASALSDADGVSLDQEDVFFNSKTGRLKLRVQQPTLGELIFYDRPDKEAPKPSVYNISVTSDPASLRAVLASALGIRGVVKKKRLLHRLGQTRIHLDEVEGLGQFVELEFVMLPEQAVELGVTVLRDLMKKLGIRDEDLVSVAYIDLLSSS